MKEYVDFHIIAILSESLDKDLGKIIDSKFLIKDLGGDSFGITDIKLKIAKKFNMPIDFLDLNKKQDITVMELKQLVHSFLNI